MTAEVLSDYPQVQSLHVAEVVNYLQQNQWTSIRHPNSRLLVFEKGTDDQGKPIQIVLPSKDDYEDTSYLLTKAVKLLSILESIPFPRIIDVINSAEIANGK